LGGVTFAFPLNFIEYGVVLDGPLVRGADGREMYVLEGSGATPAEAVGASDTSHFARDTVQGAALPVVRLARVLGLPGDASSNKGLIVGVGERRAVVVVDVVLNRQEVVIKQLDSVMAQHPLLNGATLDAEGRVIPILNLPALLKFAELNSGLGSGGSGLGSGAGASSAGVKSPGRESKGQLRVLVVDDSLSVRKVQERLLRDLGCVVSVAADGLGALERLREQEFDFVFTDLEMPRLNGYELISELRGNPAWAGLPVVVVSSRGADKYITKAMNLGASTFLSKPFTPQQLQQVLTHYAKGAGPA
jgi:chemosensory pili system protein ChpA (sensor histidine kinase/response regulator)